MPRLKTLAALGGYAAVSILFTFPLIMNFSTHLPGLLSEFSYSVWNLWHFRFTVSELGTNPLWTDFQYAPYGGNLLLVHYTILNNILAYPLLPILGLEATSNLFLLCWLTLAGFGIYLLLTDWGYEPGVSFSAGVLYLCSQFMTLYLQHGRGQDYTGVHPLPFFVWALSRALRDRKLIDVVLAALCLTWIWTYSYYHFLFCLLLLPLFFLFWDKPLSVDISRRPPTTFQRTTGWLLAGGLAIVFLYLATTLRQGQIAFRGKGSMKDIIAYVAPYLAFWGLLGTWLWNRFRVSLGLKLTAFRWENLKPYIGVIACYGALNWPLIAAMLYFMGSGDGGEPVNRWRGGGDPLDLSFILLPGHYAHPLWGDWFSRHMPSFLFNDDDPSIGFLPILSALWLWRRRPQDPWVKLWLASSAFFFLLMLGPWLKIFGVNTYLPMPFYFLHLFPVFIHMTNGRYFTVMLSLFIALVFAVALKTLQERLSPRSARWVPAAALLLIAFEFSHGGLTLFRLDYPPLLHRLRDRPYGSVFLVPASSAFRFMKGKDAIGTEFLLDKNGTQIIHQKPYAGGGKLGRIARRVFDAMNTDPIWQGILAAQEGAKPSALLKDKPLMSRYFRNNQVLYVLSHDGMIPLALKEAMESWPMDRIDEDGPLRLYRVRAITTPRGGEKRRPSR